MATSTIKGPSSQTIELQPTMPDSDTSLYGGGIAAKKYGNVVSISVSVKITNAQVGYSHRKEINLNLPNFLRPSSSLETVMGNGEETGYTRSVLYDNGRLTLYPQKNGTTYAIGMMTYIVA